VFDTEILERLPRREDRRVNFIHESLKELKQAQQQLGGGLHVLYGRAPSEIPALAARLSVGGVFANRDYEPQALVRDRTIHARLKEQGRDLHLFKDQAIFDTDEVLTAQRAPYTVFSPYKRAWLETLQPFHLTAYPVERYCRALVPADGGALPTLEQLGHRPTDLNDIGLLTGISGGRTLFQDFLPRMDAYHERRDYPALHGPSYLSVHLRFGTVSIRTLAAAARNCAGKGADTWLSELIWRDFYFAILHHFPHVAAGAFRREFDALEFPDPPGHFEAWCEARTGYPLVDAAMRQLVSSGYMHNRLRMVTASFLTKDLHVHWRRGEAFFAQWLNDFDLSANNGGWQWAASSGCDAQPYFRIFNPVLQSKRFDPEGRFIRSWLPELTNVPLEHVHTPWTMPTEVQRSSGCFIGKDYPAPLVDHEQARRRTLKIYGRLKKSSPDTRTL
jgi:deoxyribodipyrimidine photo-lyase